MRSAIPFEREQQRLIREIATAWSDRAPLQARLDDYVGGMAFKTVTGAEYLVRYKPDPITRKKRFVSLGRRSEETERQLSEWLADRQAFRTTLAELDDRIEHLGRLAKAYRLGRVPAKVGDLLRRLDETRFLGERLIVRGDIAIFAYEVEAGIFAPSSPRQAEPTADIELLTFSSQSALRSDMVEAFGQEVAFATRAGNTVGRIGQATFVVNDIPYEGLVERTSRQFAVSRDSRPVPLVVPSRPDWIEIERAIKFDKDEDDRFDFVRHTMSDEELDFERELYLVRR